MGVRLEWVGMAGLAVFALVAPARAVENGGAPVAGATDENGQCQARLAGTRAMATGDFERAIVELERAHRDCERRPDPELHYLRGEALYAVGRASEARDEHALAERQIGPAPQERMHKLWLARIYVRRGELSRADPIYESLWPAAPAVDAEVAINQAEAHVLVKDWAGAVPVLARLLERDPKNVRGREMLAWIMEVTGDLDRELSVRAALASDHPTEDSLRGWGRALERAREFPEARDRYETALATATGSDAALATSVARMRYRTTPEVGVGVIVRHDPQADALRMQAAGVLPFGPRHGLALVGWHETSEGQVLRNGLLLNGGGAETGVGAALTLGNRAGGYATIAGDVRSAASAPALPAATPRLQTLRAGASADVALPLLGHVEVHGRGEYAEPWSDAAVTLSEGGRTSGASANVFLYPTSRRFLLIAGGQWRQLRLAPIEEGGSEATSSQRAVFGGFDAVLWSNPVRLLRSETLDDRMVSGAYISDAAIVSYRHQQMWGDSSPDFATRIVLAPRAAVHLGSATVRKVLAWDRLGTEAHGALGYDTARSAMLYAAGASVAVAPWWWGRLQVSYELTRETAGGFTGVRQAGWVSCHADL